MKYCLLIVTAFVLFASCEKVTPTESAVDMLRAEKWALDTGFINKKLKGDGETIPADIELNEVYAEPVCREDDQLLFRAGNEGAHVPGEKTCSINETSEIEFRWGLSENDKKIYIYDAKEFFGEDINAELVEMYKDKFTIRYVSYVDKEMTVDNQRKWLRDTLTYTLSFKKFVPKKP